MEERALERAHAGNRSARGDIVSRFAAGEENPEFENVLPVCATETKIDADPDRFADALRHELS